MANTTAAIMALPTPLDSIRLVGDEEKHATLLFFGETSTLPGEARQTLLDSVAMACKMLSPFGESVTDVVRLGSDVPPALVALLSGGDLCQVRNLFMMNPAVEGYRSNTQQFPSFTPHVTLGHPDFTDEAIIRALMRQIFRVRFDRLSVWWNDERFDCPLDWAGGNDTPMSEAVDNFMAKHAVENEDHLEHHGVKGQKWGVKNSSSTSQASSGAKQASSSSSQASSGAKQAQTVLVDQRYAKKAAAIAGVSVAGLGLAALAPAVVPASVVLAAGGTAVLSTKIALAASVATRAAYVHNYVSYVRRSKAGPSPVAHAVSEDRTVEQVYNDLTPEKATAAHRLIDAYSRGIEFADDSEIQSGWASMSPMERSVVLFLASGTDGPKEGMAHADLVIDAVLEHHGIKGQKWGVRRAVNAVTGRVSRGRSSTPGEPGLISRTSSADQIHQDRIASKIVSGGVHSLSNADIQAYSRRLQLTKDLDRALSEQSAVTKAKSDGFIKSFVKKQGGRQIDRVVNKSLDVAVEAAIRSAGVKVSGGKLSDFSKSNPSKSALGDNIQIVAGRLAPKKGK